MSDSKLNSSDWEAVGVVSVDSGLMTIGDPCYHSDGFNWHDFCDFLWANEERGTLDQGTRLTVSGFGGDGAYPVYVRREGGLIVAAAIVFDCDEGHRLRREGVPKVHSSDQEGGGHG